MKNIWVPLSGQIAQQNKVETIANNIANANTAGFKKDTIAFKEYLTALEKGQEDIDIPHGEWKPSDFYKSQGAENAMVTTSGTYTSFEQGPLQPTNNPLDLALNGPGFFEVLTPRGIRYTRKGSFGLNANGEIVNDQGNKLLLAASDPNASLESRVAKITNSQKISISREGDIFTSQGITGRISVIEFKDVHSLKKEGNSLFINQHPDNQSLANKTTAVNQGFIEGSNVNAIHEMSELIKAHRHFDNIQKAINTYDNITGRAVNDIAKF